MDNKSYFKANITLFDRIFGGATLFSISINNCKIEGLGGTGIDLKLSSITAKIDLQKFRFFWGKITLNTIDYGEVIIQGFLWNKTVEIYKVLKSNIEQEVAKQQELLKEVHTSLRKINKYAAKNYLTNSMFSEFMVEVENIIPSIVPEFVEAHTPKLIEALEKANYLLANPEKTRKSLNATFRKNECKQYTHIFDNVESNPLRPKQRDACTSLDRFTLVVAGAGSGKTSLTVGRSAYLSDKYNNNVQIYALAFGKDAKTELTERFKKRNIDIEGKIFPSTFHSLGYSQIKSYYSRTNQKTPTLTDLRDKKLTDWIKDQISELCKDDEYFARLVEYFISTSRAHVDSNIYDTEGDYYKRLQEVGTDTIKGERVKSIEEVAIANFLFIHGIEYKYEKDYFSKEQKIKFGFRYKPDFYLSDYDIFIEHFGVDANHIAPAFFNDPEKYTSDMWKKIQLHKDMGTNLISTFSFWFQNRSFRDQLSAELMKKGVLIEEVSYETFKVRVLEYQKSRIVSGFYKLLSDFISSYKASTLSIEEISTKLKEHSYRSGLFSSIFIPIFNRYQEALTSAHELDFSDMVNDATKLLKEGKTKIKCTDILVDEYQDISPARMDFVKAILNQNHAARLFCVGDDKQAIYRFTGSDVTYTSRFKNRVGIGTDLGLDMTFRCCSNITESSTLFVIQNPEHCKMNPKVDSFSKSNSPAITLIQYSKEPKGDSDIEAAVVKSSIANLVNSQNESDNMELFVIGRARKHCTPQISDAINTYNKSNKVSFTTAHSSKGNEADHVIIVGMTDQINGFPNKIENDPIINLVLPEQEDYPFAEERRLFYVALTRAKKSVIIPYDINNCSTFIHELLKHYARGNIEINHISYDRKSSPLEVIALEKCPTCISGDLILRTTKNNKTYTGCSNYPYCDYNRNACPSCGSHVRLIGEVYKCTDAKCNWLAPLCPICKDGHLHKVTNQKDTYTSCSNWKKGCDNKNGKGKQKDLSWSKFYKNN